ncbi:MAG TPA: serine hydrolase domain-containing protein [Sphingomicrobium sp.]|nr:serine hydrolase domain-containing protein [Sphingomicrobium sp.]
MEVSGVPGVGISIGRNGGIAWSGSFGVKNLRTRDPVTGDTLFEAASMTKPAFAYVVMKLVDEGRLELSRPLVGYHRPAYLGDDPALDRITVRDVLRHSTGLPNWAEGTLVTIAPPGTTYTYSGEGFVWLQLIAEKVTGEATGELMARHLFRPAGMNRSTMGWDARVERAAAYGHGDREPGSPDVPEQPTRKLAAALLPVAARWRKPIDRWTYEDQVRAMQQAVPDLKPVPHELLVNAAGGLMTTPSDYVRFMLLMMDHRTRAPWQISEGSRQAMLSHELDIAGPRFYRGLGWQREDPAGMTIFEHSGSNYGIFHSLAVGDARSGNAIAVFTNGANGAALAERIVRDCTGLELMKFLA